MTRKINLSPFFVLIGGAGDDCLLGDLNLLTDDFNWYYVQADGTYVRQFYDWRGPIERRSVSEGANDVLYGGEGRDWIIASRLDGPMRPRQRCRSITQHREGAV